MSRNNISKNNNYFKTTYDIVKYTKPKYDKIIEWYNGTPITVRILNVIVPFILTYIFTIINYKLSLSIVFGILTFLTMLLYNRPIAYTFIVLYIIIIVKVSNSTNKILGNPLKETNIYMNNSAYSCAGHSLTVPNTWFPAESNGGYFTYSYWLYINGNNNNINKENNWNNYRYSEWKSIFYRGSVINDSEDLSKLLQFPGFWLTPKINNLVIVFQNSTFVERLEIDNIEFNKWMNIVLVVEMKSVSIYINGILERTLNLYQNASLMNNYNLYISGDKLISKNKKKSGFPGYIANLIYYNHSLTVNDIISGYNYYKKIIDSYQNNLLRNNRVEVNSKLITN